MVKVWHVIDSGGLYGAEVMLLNLVAEQEKMDLQPTIISIGSRNSGEKDIEQEGRRRGHRIIPARMWDGPNIIGAYKIIKMAQKEKVTLLHCHGYKADILFGCMPKFIRKIPIVCTLHGYIAKKKINRMWFYIWLDIQILRYFNAVILVNRAMLNVQQLKNKKKFNFEVINNGIFKENNCIAGSIVKYNEQGSLIKEFCLNNFIVGSIGRLSEEKGHKYLINAVGGLLAQGLNIRLLIMGDGPERERLESLVERLGIEKEVYFSGYCKNSEYYLKYFNVMALPSLTEGLPITLLEAMKNRVPIIATNVGGIPHVIENGIGGLLVLPKDVNALIENIKSIYENKLLRDTMTSNSYQVFLEYYTSEIMASKYHNVYKKVVNV